MVTLTRIYTRGGDKGETSLGDGSRVPKDSALVEAYGAVDEANAPKFFTGAKLEPIDGPAGKIDSRKLAHALAHAAMGGRNGKILVSPNGAI